MIIHFRCSHILVTIIKQWVDPQKFSLGGVLLNVNTVLGTFQQNQLIGIGRNVMGILVTLVVQPKFNISTGHQFATVNNIVGWSYVIIQEILVVCLN